MGQELLNKYNVKEVDSLVLLSNNKAYIYSDAALQIAKRLNSKWRYLAIFRFFPKPFRDFIYKTIAKYRYRVFGKKEHCILPTLEMQSRFLS